MDDKGIGSGVFKALQEGDRFFVCNGVQITPEEVVAAITIDNREKLHDWGLVPKVLQPLGGEEYAEHLREREKALRYAKILKENLLSMMTTRQSVATILMTGKPLPEFEGVTDISDVQILEAVSHCGEFIRQQADLSRREMRILVEELSGTERRSFVLEPPEPQEIQEREPAIV